MTELACSTPQVAVGAIVPSNGSQLCVASFQLQHHSGKLLVLVVPYSNHGCLVSYTRAICVSFTPGSTVDMQFNLSGQMCLHSEHDWLGTNIVGCFLTCSDTDLKRYIENAVEVDPERPVLVDKYMDRADELDVDALADKDGNVTICGIMQHIEQAGVHSGMLVSYCDTFKQAFMAIPLAAASCKTVSKLVCTQVCYVTQQLPQCLGCWLLLVGSEAHLSVQCLRSRVSCAARLAASQSHSAAQPSSQ